MCYHNVRFYIATCDLLLSVRSVEFYPQVTEPEYAAYKNRQLCWSKLATEVAGLIESRLKYQHSDNCKPKLIFSKSGATNNATSHSLWLSPTEK